MADHDNTTHDKKEKHGIFYFIQKLFSKKSEVQQHKVSEQNGQDYHLEPKYWPEVIDFIDNLNNLIKIHTIEDSNIQHINQRIVDYVVEQINVKGSLRDIEQRYSALNTLADRIQSNTISKIVGLKHIATTHADFSEAIEEFKKRLSQRHQSEIAFYANKIQDNSTMSH
ncbi:MAG: hypothetical protein AB7V32_03375 [Candidatus Berkiella sp.]